MKDNSDIYDVNKMVNKFNKCFINVGPSLAKNIPKIMEDNADGNTIMDNVGRIFL